MVKAALLYGDRARLYSLTSSLLLLVLEEVDQMQPATVLDLIASLAPVLAKNRAKLVTLLEQIAAYRSLKGKAHLSVDEFIHLTKIERVLIEATKEMQVTIHQLAQEAGVKGLQRAIKAELLELHSFSESNTGIMVNQYLSAVQGALTTDNTYPFSIVAQVDSYEPRYAKALSRSRMHVRAVLNM
jgi:hypothetical protein